MADSILYQLGSGDLVIPARIGNLHAWGNFSGATSSATVVPASAGQTLYVTSLSLTFNSGFPANATLYITGTNTSDVCLAWMIPSGVAGQFNSPPGFFWRAATAGSALLVTAGAPGGQYYLNVTYGYTALSN